MTILATQLSADRNNGNTVALPAGISEGNILTMVAYTGNSGETISLPVDWTVVNSGGSTGSTYVVFQKQAGASETNPVISVTRQTDCLTFLSDGALGAIVGEQGYGSNSTNYVFPSITLTESADVLRVAMVQLGANVSSGPGDGTLLIDNLSSNVGMAAWRVAFAAGATGTDSITIDTARRGMALTIGLEEQPAVIPDTQNVDIPLHINLKWNQTYELALTDEVGTGTLSNVTLSQPVDWDLVTYDGTVLDPATTESFQEYSQADVGITMEAGDQIAWFSTANVTVNANGTVDVTPASDVAAVAYKIWDESAQTWSAVSAFTINDLGDFVSGFDSWALFMASLDGKTYTDKLERFLEAKGYSGLSVNEGLFRYLLTQSNATSHTARWQEWAEGGYN